jgi:hypothetical protein
MKHHRRGAHVERRKPLRVCPLLLRGVGAADIDRDNHVGEACADRDRQVVDDAAVDARAIPDVTRGKEAGQRA